MKLKHENNEINESIINLVQLLSYGKSKNNRRKLCVMKRNETVRRERNYFTYYYLLIYFT